MMLYGKTDAEYFEMLSQGKKHEFRQIEGIILENKDTGETKQFQVTNIELMDPFQAKKIKEKYSKVSWENKPIFAIYLGDEVVHEKVERTESVDAGRLLETRKRWYAITE
jgi:hypothetical protein